jgi:hypothetical protein
VTPDSTVTATRVPTMSMTTKFTVALNRTKRRRIRALFLFTFVASVQ